MYVPAITPVNSCTLLYATSLSADGAFHIDQLGLEFAPRGSSIAYRRPRGDGHVYKKDGRPLGRRVNSRRDAAQSSPSPIKLPFIGGTVGTG